jgi:hypothetical protein
VEDGSKGVLGILVYTVRKGSLALPHESSAILKRQYGRCGIFVISFVALQSQLIRISNEVVLEFGLRGQWLGP